MNCGSEGAAQLDQMGQLVECRHRDRGNLWQTCGRPRTHLATPDHTTSPGISPVTSANPTHDHAPPHATTKPIAAGRSMFTTP